METDEIREQLTAVRDRLVEMTAEANALTNEAPPRYASRLSYIVDDLHRATGSANACLSALDKTENPDR